MWAVIRILKICFSVLHPDAPHELPPILQSKVSIFWCLVWETALESTLIISHLYLWNHSGRSKKTPPPPTESDTFFSTYHNTPQRRNFSDNQWKSLTKECTKKGLEELVSSPEFNRWAVAHAERITLAPIEKDPSATRRKWFFWFR